MPHARPTSSRARAGKALPPLPGAWRPAFLLALSELAVVQHACDAACINRRTAYRARSGDPAFAAAWDDAMEAGVDAAEQEAIRRAVHGVEEPVIHEGKLAMVRDPVSRKQVPLTVRRYSDQLLILILRGRRKSVYADRLEVTAPPSDPLSGVGRAVRMQSLLALAQKRQAEGDSSESRADAGAAPTSTVRPPRLPAAPKS